MNAHTVPDTAAQPFGALLDAILVRFAEHALFEPASTDQERKKAITAAYERGDLTRKQCAMLVEAFGLRDA